MDINGCGNLHSARISESEPGRLESFTNQHPVWREHDYYHSHNAGRNKGVPPGVVTVTGITGEIVRQIQKSIDSCWVGKTKGGELTRRL